MKAWLNAGGGGALERFGVTIVFDRTEAILVQDKHVGEVLKAAIMHYPEYDWTKIPASKPGHFLIEGTPKK